MKSVAIPYARHVQIREIVDRSRVEQERAANVEYLECGENHMSDSEAGWRKSALRTRDNSPAAYLTLGTQDMAGEAALWLATGSTVGAGTYTTPGVAAQAAIAILARAGDIKEQKHRRPVERSF